jgi:hypothetical protein
MKTSRFRAAASACVLLIASLGGTPSLAAAGEPSEAQMRSAVERIVAADRAKASAMLEKCKYVRERSESVGGQMTAFECLIGLATAEAMAKTSIASFEKLHCGAATTGGHYCDYSILMSSPLGLSTPRVNKSRFVSTKQGWMALD